MSWCKSKHWTITRSWIGGKCEKADPSHTIPFRLKDDDGRVYFHGKMSTELLNSPEIFQPLDATMYDYGCTSLEIKLPDSNDWEYV